MVNVKTRPLCVARFGRLALIHGLVLALVAGCSYWTGHENFKFNMMSNVGQNIGKAVWARPSDLVRTVTLPNGHLAYTYKLSYSPTCLYTYEVNPDTRIIVAVSWEGSEKDCAMVQ